MRGLLQDFRYGVRMLGKAPSFTAIAGLTLALGIGATTAIFSVVYGLLIRPLAVPEARQVVEVVRTYRGELAEDSFTYQQFRYVQEHSRWPAAIAAYTHMGLNLSAGDSAERVSALHVSSDYFQVLAAKPVLGRDFSLGEDNDRSARVVILSQALWTQRFGSDRSVLDRTILLNGSPYRVIGVMSESSGEIQLDQVPPAFGDLQHIDLWTTLAPVAEFVGSGENLQVIARIKPTVALAQATAELDALTDSFRREQLEGEGRQQSLALKSVQEVLASDISTYLWILLAAVAFVLLIACANISNLLLARGAVRGKEAAVRSALGADRHRLVRQFLLESLTLAGVGGIAGVILARPAVEIMLRFIPAQLPRAKEIHVDGWALLFALGVTIISGAVAGVMPALRASQSDVSSVLKENAAQSTGGRRRGRLRDGLVVSEIALSLILLIGASLLAESFVNLLRVSPGFEASGLLSAEIWLSGSRLHTNAELNTFYRNVISRLRALPGVGEAAIVSSGQPLERGGNVGVIVNGNPHGSIDFRVITPEYFHTLRATVMQGRDFDPSDSESSEPVAIVNEAFVRRILEGRDPFRSTVQIEGGDVSRRIVGVAANVKSFVGFPPEPTVFLPAPQAKMGLILDFDVWFPTHVLIRTSGDPGTTENLMNTAIRESDSSIPVGRIFPMEQILARSLATQRFMMLIVAVFAVLALVLASIGIYGLIAFSVSQRTHELGIRMVLGADPRSVITMVLREGGQLVMLGAMIGVVGALALHHAIASVLFGVQPTDWRTMAGACSCLLVIALLACYIPARRATKVDPLVALRYE